MTLREALLESDWESFRNDQNEEWNVADLLLAFLPGESNWLDAECTVSGAVIIDCQGDELMEV